MVAHKAVAQRILEACKQGPHEARIGAVTDFGLGEDRVLRGDGDVGVEGKPGTGAHGPAVDGPDNRLAKFQNSKNAVFACRESPSRSCNDNGTDLRILFGLSKGVFEFTA